MIQHTIQMPAGIRYMSDVKDVIYEPVTIINIGAELESIIRALEPEGEKRIRYNQLLITNDYEPDWKKK